MLAQYLLSILVTPRLYLLGCVLAQYAHRKGDIVVDIHGACIVLLHESSFLLQEVRIFDYAFFDQIATPIGTAVDIQQSKIHIKDIKLRRHQIRPSVG